MSRFSHRSLILATAVVLCSGTMPGVFAPAFAREYADETPLETTETPQVAAPATRPVDRSTYDPDQETPAAPVTPAPGRDPYPSSSPGTGRFLLGDAFGLHSTWDERGVSLYTSFTSLEQGVASGGFEQAFRWGGKFDILAHLDSTKLGLWDGGMFDLFVESRLGQSIDGFAGVYSPTNLAMFFPVPDAQITAITGLKFTQAVTERTGIFFGKLNALNGDREKFLKYPLTSRFWNAAFNFNLALDRYPYSTPGAGFYSSPRDGTDVAFLVLDSHNAPRTSGLENFGRNGVFLYAEAKQAVTFFGLPGKQTFAGLYGTGSFADLAPASFIALPVVAAATPSPLKAGTWTALWNIEQRLIVDPNDSRRGLGLYIQMGLSDGNPNPVRGFISAAVCGNSPLPGRDGDLWGVGFYDLALSTHAKDLFTGFRDEHGVELFYNLRVVPGCHLTPDIQFIHPGLAPIDDALVLGLRMKVDF